jgi:hypothetical protein
MYASFLGISSRTQRDEHFQAASRNEVVGQPLNPLLKEGRLSSVLSIPAQNRIVRIPAIGGYYKARSSEPVLFTQIIYYDFPSWYMGYMMYFLSNYLLYRRCQILLCGPVRTDTG